MMIYAFNGHYIGYYDFFKIYFSEEIYMKRSKAAVKTEKRNPDLRDVVRGSGHRRSMGREMMTLQEIAL